MRLWQNVVQFTAGQPAPLDGLGIAVTIGNPVSPDPIWGRPYWEFAVRPLTPNAVYPQEYLTQAQPPTGEHEVQPRGKGT